MSSYFDKIIGKKKATEKKPRHSRKLVSLDDSDLNDDSNPNIQFQQSRQSPEKVTDPPRRQISQRQELNIQVKAKPTRNQSLPSLPKKQSPSLVQLSPSRVKREPMRRQPESHLQIINDQYEEEPSQEDAEVHGVSRKSLLSLWESLNLDLGHFFYTYSFPIRRQIPIIANVLDLERQKYENGTYISQSFDNNLQISFLLFFLRAVILQSFLNLHTILWITAIILSFLINTDLQYRPGREILIGIFAFFCVFVVVLQYLSVRGRRSWTEPTSDVKYKVYRYDPESMTGEWIPTIVSDLRPGNIYKLPKSTLTNLSVIPADSILLHGPRTIIQVDESAVIQYLSPLEKQQRITLKQTLVKSPQITFPLTGVVHYELAAPEIMPENIYGRFLLQQPKQETYNVTYNNILLRGTKMIPAETLLAEESNKNATQLYTKEEQMIAVVLETGIDSLVLKTCQYPYQIRKQYPYVRIINIIMIVCSILYLLVIGVGVLMGYINLTNTSMANVYYIDNYLTTTTMPVSLGQIVMYHFGNFVMIIPILLKVAYLLYVNLMGFVISKKLNIKIKDMNMISDLVGVDVLVTTLGADLIKMGKADQNNSMQQSNKKDKNLSIEQSRQLIRNRSLQSIRVGNIMHNFLTTSIDNPQYSTSDVDMISYFMSIALLTCNRKSPSPLEMAIIERCHKQLNVRIEKQDDSGVLKIGQLRVIRIFTIPATQKFPFKIVFYRHGKDLVQDIENQNNQQSRDDLNVNLIQRQRENQKILCLIRGETAKITTKMAQADGYVLRQFSNRNHQEKGYHIQMLGKFVVSYEEFVEMKKLYLNVDEWENEKGRDKQSYSSISGDKKSKVTQQRCNISRFYEVLDRYIQKIDPMGLLIWENPYSILSSTLSPISSLPQLSYKIIIVPPSKSQVNPQFQSIHAITNYLLKTSKLSLRQISNKILHSYTDKQTFWTQLRNEKLLVLNGWDYRMVKRMIVQLKQMTIKNKQSNRNRSKVKILGYIEQDQYAWILKQTDFSISTKGDGYDLEKFSDFLINSSTSTSTTTSIIGKLFICAQMYSYCINAIIIVQFMKGMLLATIEFINVFQTWGTGLVLIGSPLYLLLEVGVFLDVFYYIFAKPNNLANNYNSGNVSNMIANLQDSKLQRSSKDQKVPFTLPYDSHLSAQSWVFQFFFNLVVGAFITFIPTYSLTEPPTPYGTPEPKQFNNVLIHFVLYHVLIFRKIFLNPYNFSLFKFLVLGVQIAVYYVGLLIISAFDTYLYKGIIWYMIKGKIILVAGFMVWMAIGFYWLKFMFEDMIKASTKQKNDKYEKVYPSARREQQQIRMKERKVGQAVEID